MAPIPKRDSEFTAVAGDPGWGGGRMIEMVAEDRLKRNHRQENPLFFAVSDKRSGTTRYHNPLGWRLTREYQICLTQSFAKVHAMVDYEKLETSQSRPGRV
jgi:hypothetical protein